MHKECFNCKHYIFFEGEKLSDLIEICCKHKIRIIAEENLACRGWEPDNFHDHDAMERQIQKIDQAVSRKE